MVQLVGGSYRTYTELIGLFIIFFYNKPIGQKDKDCIKLVCVWWAWLLTRWILASDQISQPRVSSSRVASLSLLVCCELQTHAGEPGGGGVGAIKIWIKNKDSDRTNIESVTQCLTTQEDGWTKEHTASTVFVSSLHDDWIIETLDRCQCISHSFSHDPFLLSKYGHRFCDS